MTGAWSTSAQSGGAWSTGAWSTGAWSTGGRGKAVAAVLAVLVLTLAGFGAVVPLWSWFDHQQAVLMQRQALLRHMRDVAMTLPRLREEANRSQGLGPEAMAVLPGATDALAAAALQERIQRMATSAGASLAAVETMPAAKVGEWQEVSLRVSLNAPWPVVMDLLRSIEKSFVHVDDLDLHSAAVVAHSATLPIQASMVIYGFRPAHGEAGL